MTNSNPTPVVTFTILFGEKYLLIQRASHEEKYGGVWAFPGGRVEVGETVIEAVLRESMEETGVELSGRFFFVDSYFYGDSVGIHFALEALSDEIRSEECASYHWVDLEAGMSTYRRIPGLDNHISLIRRMLSGSAPWQSLEDANLIEHKFLNR